MGVAEEGAAGDEAVVTGDEVLTPIAGRISDRTVDRRGGHAAASVLLAAGAAAAVLAGRAPADARRTGNNRNGVFTGVWTAGETLGLALGPGLYAVVLAAGGYVSSTAGTVATQPSSALVAIIIGFSVVPALLVLASLVPLSRCRLTEEDL